ncbi:MAG: hypothetical protein ACLQG5_06225 [Methanobacterium sp.]
MDEQDYLDIFTHGGTYYAGARITLKGIDYVDNLDDNQIRRKILEILYDYEIENPRDDVESIELNKKLGVGVLDKEVEFNINYLENKGFVDVTGRHFEGFEVKITHKGIDLVENNEEFNNLFPQINLTQNIIQNSKGVVINSNHVNMSIDESFNQIYYKIEERNLENVAIIKEAIKNIEEEFKKDCISKTEIQASISIIDSLKGNAYWIVPMVAQVMTSILLYKPV